MKLRIHKLLLACLLASTAWQNIVIADSSLVESEKKLTKDDIVPASLFFATKDMQMLLGGRVREEYFYSGRSQTLRSDFSDVINAWRHKASLMVGVRQGARRHGKPATEALLKITNYSMWRNEGRYTGLEETDLQIQSLDGAHIGDHTHRQLVPTMFAEDAYLKINFDAFLRPFHKHPTYLQIGYFPYWIGRGVALGYYVDGGVPHMGWNLDGNARNLEQSPAGVVLSGEIIKNLTATFYYTKWQGVTVFLGDTRAPSRIQRLEAPRPERGSCKDTETWAFKLDYKLKEKNWDLLLEPYIMYTRAPEQSIEVKADARSELGTYGAMVEFNWKRVHVNLEAAGQFGHQDVFGIDRNVVQLKRDKVTGNVQEVNSHIFYGDAATLNSPAGIPALIAAGVLDGATTDNNVIAVLANQNAPVKATTNLKTPAVVAGGVVVVSPINHQLLNVENLSINRAADKNGVQLQTANAAGAPVTLRVSDKEVSVTGANAAGVGFINTIPATAAARVANAQFADLTADQNVVNSNLVGNERFRKPFKLDYSGFMFLGDISYTFEKCPLKIALAGTYISGDAYPYNEQRSRKFKGFMTQRDYNYIGHEVRSLAVLFVRVGPRPMNISYNKMYAYNHFQDMSNLAYIGGGLNWFPLKKRDKMSINTNVLGFWTPGRVNKWDVNAAPNINTGNAVNDKLQNAVIAGVPAAGIEGIRTKLGFKGWETTHRASSYMGTELNLIAEYFVLENLRLYTLDAIFLPGQLYKDLKGQPNRNTRRLDVTPGREGEAVYESLGTQIAYGLNLGIRYTF
ncbi:hypothetical protein JST56_01625 [Candidatus Dependentiae bacterium]|nr:hypothetical protein [Candidatus Dependentiae bacterium]